MDEQECGCFKPNSLNDLCPQCRVAYDEYVRIMVMLRKSIADSERTRSDVPTQREVIRFDTEPVKLKLDQGPYAGIECHGQYGVDWRYSVNNGKATMYLPEDA